MTKKELDRMKIEEIVRIRLDEIKNSFAEFSIDFLSSTDPNNADSAYLLGHFSALMSVLERVKEASGRINWA